MTVKGEALFIVQLVLSAVFLAAAFPAKATGGKAFWALLTALLLSGARPLLLSWRVRFTSVCILFCFVAAGAGVIPMEEHIKIHNSFNNNSPSAHVAFGAGFSLQIASWSLLFCAAIFAFGACKAAGRSVAVAQRHTSTSSAGNAAEVTNPIPKRSEVQ